MRHENGWCETHHPLSLVRDGGGPSEAAIQVDKIHGSERYGKGKTKILSGKCQWRRITLNR